MREPLGRAVSLRLASSGSREIGRVLPEETPVALVYDGATHAVMMATPADLRDFALGFSLTDGKIDSIDNILELEIVEHTAGIEARLWLTGDARVEVARMRRAMIGPTGCGLCGIDSLAAALPDPPRVAQGARFTHADIVAAVGALRPAQMLNREAGALHAAAFWSPARGLELIREDVGRHNALDKLAGALAQREEHAEPGIVVLTSRVSVEMVQKAAMIGAPVLAAVSAPTALAVRTAERAGLTLVALARGETFEVFTHPWRFEATPSRAAAHLSQTEAPLHVLTC